MTDTSDGCVLCSANGENILWQDALCRVILVDEPAYPGFCRVILNTHIKEMTDLPSSDRSRLFAVVMAVEDAVRQVMKPDKINLATLGNVVPHLHWHVIPRFVDDAHFPNPIWGEIKRAGKSHFDRQDIEERLRQVINEKLT
jgi:diadenosine tetraphosphate (Ap4A) HIT family hydrolase